MNHIKHLFLIIALLAGQTAFAQAIYSIKFHLTDEKTAEPVSFATASVTVKGEKSPLKYVLSDDKGDVLLNKLKKGTYILKAELMGYVTFTKEVVLEKNLDLGVVNLVAAEDVERDITPLEAFITEHTELVIIISVILVLIIALLIFLLSIRSSRKRRRARRRSRTSKGRRYRD